MITTGKEFMEKTKYKYLPESDQSLGYPAPPVEEYYDRDANIIDLPDPDEITVADMSLIKAIENRMSLRKYSDQNLSLEELSYLLWCTQGVKKMIGQHATLRIVPSAGARHSFETYLLINKVEGLKPGLYRFIALEHKLVEVNLNSDIAEKILHGCHNQAFVRTSAATFIWVAVPYRMSWRYGQRGYRYLHLDAGHVCQNLYLSAEAINCGVCAIAAFDDDEMNSILSLDGDSQFVIYIGTVGKK